MGAARGRPIQTIRPIMSSDENDVRTSKSPKVTRKLTPLERCQNALRVKSPEDLAFEKNNWQVNLLRYAIVLWQNTMGNDVTRRASSLTYTTILSLFPVFVLLIAMGSFFFTPERQNELIFYIQEKIYPSVQTDEVVETTEEGHTPDLAREDAGDKQANISSLRTFISDRADTFRKSAAGIGFMGFVAMLLAAWALYAAIENAIDSTWSGRAKRSMKRTFMTFTTLLVVAPVVIAASLTVSTLSVTARGAAEGDGASDGAEVATSAGIMDKSPTWLKSFGNSAIGSVAKAYESVLPIVPITINILFITSAYIFIPQVRVRWKCALLGGVVSGVMWEISKMGFGAYVFNSALRREIFLSLGAVPIFLVWLYISWVVFLLGNEVAFTTQNFKKLAYQSFFRRPHTTLDGKLFVATLFMVQKHYEDCNGPLNQQLVAMDLNLSPAETLEIVSRLIADGLLLRTEKPTGLIPGRPADKILLRDVIALGCDARELSASSNSFGDSMTSPLVRLQSRLLDVVDSESLAEFMASPAASPQAEPST